MKTKEVVKSVHEMLLNHGNESYGEDMTVLSHSLQSADIAFDQNQSDDLIIAALLHDIGHILPNYVHEEVKYMEGFGTLHHETIAKNYLIKNGFPLSVAEPIFLHVDAKRYLCTANLNYYKTLSAASQTTMKYQGGLMTDEEIIKFETNLYSKEAIILRHIDDLAKDINYEATPQKLDYWMDKLNEYLN